MSFLERQSALTVQVADHVLPATYSPELEKLKHPSF